MAPQGHKKGRRPEEDTYAGKLGAIAPCTNLPTIILVAPQKTAAYAAWPRQSQREYCGPPVGTDITLPAALQHAAVDRATRKNFPAQPCQYCRDAVEADRTNQPENCPKMRKA